MSNTPGDHEWMSIDDQNEMKINVDECIIVFGKTGSGKSSAISLFCGDEVRVSGGVDSTTKDCRIYKETDQKK